MSGREDGGQEVEQGRNRMDSESTGECRILITFPLCYIPWFCVRKIAGTDSRRSIRGSRCLPQGKVTKVELWGHHWTVAPSWMQGALH